MLVHHSLAKPLPHDDAECQQTTHLWLGWLCQFCHLSQSGNCPFCQYHLSLHLLACHSCDWLYVPIGYVGLALICHTGWLVWGLDGQRWERHPKLGICDDGHFGVLLALFYQHWDEWLSLWCGQHSLVNPVLFFCLCYWFYHLYLGLMCCFLYDQNRPVGECLLCLVLC